MPQELITVLISALSVGLTLAIQRIVSNVTKTKAAKRKEMAEADDASIDVERKRFDTTKIKDQAIKDLVDDTYLWIDQMNEALSDMRSKNLKLEAAVFEITKRAEQAERMRDWYRDMLKRLINIVINRCPDIDIEEYKEIIIEENEKDNPET